MRFFRFLLAVLSFISSAGFAQDSTKSGIRSNFISASFGGSFAVGNYGASESTTKGSGFATSGFNFQLELALFWTRNTGIGFTYGSFSNEINQNSFKNDLIANTTVPPGSVMKVSDVSPWHEKYFMTGPYITLPLKNLMVDFKALGGLVFTKSPGFSYSFNNGPTVLNPSIAAISSTSFGYLLGTNIRLNISPTTQFKFALDYVHTSTDSGYTVDVYSDSRRTQNISVLNLSWGLAFRIGQSR